MVLFTACSILTRPITFILPNGLISNDSLLWEACNFILTAFVISFSASFHFFSYCAHTLYQMPFIFNITYLNASDTFYIYRSKLLQCWQGVLWLCVHCKRENERNKVCKIELFRCHNCDIWWWNHKSTEWEIISWLLMDFVF